MNHPKQQQTQSKDNIPNHFPPHAPPASFNPKTSAPDIRTPRSQRVMPLASGKGAGRVTASFLDGTKPAAARNSFRVALPEIGNSSATASIAMSATDEARRGPTLVDTLAAHLMKAALDRQSNVLPAFVSELETNDPRVLPEDERITRPEKKLLIGPALGIAAGVNIMGGHSKCFAVSRKEAEQRLEKERSMNRAIFSWWEKRNACRQDENEISTVEEELRRPLWSFFRRILTEEETQCLEQLKQLQGGARLGRMGPGATMTTAGKETGNKGVPVPPTNFVSSDRGISMPLKFYERLFTRVLRRLHQHFLTILRCQATGTKDGIEMPLEFRSQGTAYVQFLLKSQLEIVESRKEASRDGDFMELYPPTVSLPEERCFRPLLEAETAYSVTLLWRILDQTKTMVPGMAWALQLFTQYVLPHVYENFICYQEHLPRAGAIGEQVEQLHLLPLNIVRQRAMLSATVQAKDDMNYMEGLMKSWAWRTWRGGVVAERRRNIGLMRLEKAFNRFHRARQLHKCFSEWRVVAKEGRFSAQLDVINDKYDTFVSKAQNAARNVQLFPGMDGIAEDQKSYMANKERFVALKLAETAQHTKAGAQGLGAATPQPLQEEDDNNNSESSSDNKGEKVLDKQHTETRRSVLDLVSRGSLVTEQARKRSQSSAEDAKETMKATVKLESQDTFITSSLGAEQEEVEMPCVKKRAMDIFNGVFQKMQDMETISGYLRQEIAIQNTLIQKLERENKGLKNKVNELEESLLSSEKKRLHYCNLLHERDLDVRELQRRIAQLKSRIRCQKHRPWQRTFMRVLGELCGASTTTSEYADELRVARDKVTATADPGLETCSPKSTTQPPQTTTTTSSDSTGSAVSANTRPESGNDQSFGLSPNVDAMPGPEEERLFGKIAPFVLSSTRNMPNAQTILCDWANNCLDDMESLDDLKGGALSGRFYLFSEEVRSGVLFSRLLFYLALPRYQNKTATAQHDPKLHGRRASANLDFTEHRRRLLLQHNVQLESPFPTYSECFGDLLNLKPSGRMSLLLRFATELVEGPEQLGDEYIQKHLANTRAATLKATDMTPLPAVDRVELQEVVDPYALARGDRCATLTFVALLYVRFAHPFNHKAKQSALIERESMLHLLSNGAYSRFERGNTLRASNDTDSSEKLSSADEEPPIARKLLEQLEEEEQSPWQLFLKYCQPLINTMAHPFILRGNFWPCVAFDSPSLAQLLGSLGLALHRSLEKHRWHIIVSCLVPVNTYSGLSRGIFTGRRATPAALQSGLERDYDWVFALDMPCVQAVFNQREAAICGAIEKGDLASGDQWLENEWRKEGHIASMDKSRLVAAFKSCGSDLLQLFLQRSTLSNSCAMPVLDLGNWRLLWVDLGLLIPEDMEKSRLDLEQLTRIFSTVLSAYSALRKEKNASSESSEPWEFQKLPHFVNELYFPEFLVAVVLLAHEMSPPVGVYAKPKEQEVVWLGDALLRLVFKYIAPKLMGNTMEAPANFLQNLRNSTKTRQVLLRHNKALLVLFNSYCKSVCGVSGMEREQVLHMLRDAMLTSTEISQSLIYELFQPFSVTKRLSDAINEEKRRETDARPRDMPAQRRRGNVSIVDPGSDPLGANNKNKEYNVLLYDGFVEFLCVLCHFKQPNPLTPFDERLDLFLRRGLLRPLSQRNDALAGVMALEKRVVEHDA